MFNLTHTENIIPVPVVPFKEVPMYFATAGIEVSPLVPPLVAFGVSFFASMGGISGAFLLLPFQMSVLGYVNPSVSATNQVFNVVAIPSGVYRYVKEGRMVWPLAWAVIVGTLPGVFIGALIRVAYLPDAKTFKLFVASVLAYIGVRLIRDLVKKKNGNILGVRKDNAVSKDKCGDSQVKIIVCNAKTLEYEFNGEKYCVSNLGIFTLSFVVGIIGGVYGIGGGAIIAPFFVSVFGLPVFTVAGAALMGTFVTSIAGVTFYQAIAPFFPTMSVAPDWMLGLLFGLGGMAGMYCGARCQKYVPAKYIKWMLALVIIGTALKYLIDYLA